MHNKSFIATVVQVNLCQKLLFLHQLTHNLTTDCSLFMKIVSSEYLQNMCAKIIVFVLFWHSIQFWYTTCSADVASFWKRFTCNVSLKPWNISPNYACNLVPDLLIRIGIMTLSQIGTFSNIPKNFQVGNRNSANSFLPWNVSTLE